MSGAWIRGVMIALVVCTTPGALASSIVPPTISLTITVPMAETSDMFIIKANNIPYYFRGSVAWYNGISSWAGMGGTDIYFGILSPDRNKVSTWVPDHGGVALKAGLAPIARSSTAGNFNTGSNSTYTFTGSEQKGMYLLFLLQVLPGGDPNNIQQWMSIDTHPFFLL